MGIRQHLTLLTAGILFAGAGIVATGFGSEAPANPPTAAVDDDFGPDPEPAKPAPASPPPAEKKPEPEPKTYASAAEAHLTFLEALGSENRFPSAAACAQCHPDHYREWSVSAHAYGQLSPVFNTMQAEINARTSGTNGDFCIRCHTQVGMQREEPIFTSNLLRHPASIEGVTCVVCHRVEGDYGKVSGRVHVEQGPIFDPVYGPRGNAVLKQMLGREDLANKLNPRPPAEGEETAVGKKNIHGDIVKFDPITTSGFCGSCHDVNLNNGFRLEEAFTQFKNSPAAARGESCQDCHMGKVPGAVVGGEHKHDDPDLFALKNYLRGSGARIGGEIWAEKGEPAGRYGIATPERKRTNHMFVGPDYSIVHPAIFPHSKDLRQAMWEYERKVPDSGDHERAGLKHLLEFRWESGWGDPESAFEKKAALDPQIEKDLPWPWNDPVARLTLRRKMNDSFRLLNEIDHQRHQLLRRGIQFGDFVVRKNDPEGIEFALQIVNGTDGHGVPTGFDAERLMFLQVTVKDRLGRVVFESGDRDPNGDVRDLHSAFVHHAAKKSGAWLAATDWKRDAGLIRQPDEMAWELDRSLFNLQSKFIVGNHRGGEREQILAVNHSIDPLPYIRPDTRPGILVARPQSARKQFRGLPPLGSRWAEYRIGADRLTGEAPYSVEFRFICQMVPVNLVRDIAGQGFDYNLSPREVGKRVAFGHRVSDSNRDEDRRGGSLTIWDQTLTLPQAPYQASLKPTEAEIMAAPVAPFPVKDPAAFGGIEMEIINLSPGEMPKHPNAPDRQNPLLPPPTPGNQDDTFE